MNIYLGTHKGTRSISQKQTKLPPHWEALEMDKNSPVFYLETSAPFVPKKNRIQKGRVFFMVIRVVDVSTKLWLSTVGFFWRFQRCFKGSRRCHDREGSCYFEFSVEKPTKFYGDFIVIDRFFPPVPLRNFQRHPGRCST